MYRHVWAEIDLDALEYNINEILKIVPAEKVMGVVKANAYGHGAAVYAESLMEKGINSFAVSNEYEALSLRTKVKNGLILILGYEDSDAVKELSENDITVCIFDLEYAKALSKSAEKSGVKLKGHIKINSGMNRLGFSVDNKEEFEDQMDTLFSLKGLNITGAFTHYAAADRDGDEDAEFTEKQYEIFCLAKEIIRKKAENSGKTNLCFHSSNSAATLLDTSVRPSDIYRAGIIIYGLTPSAGLKLPFTPKPVMSLKAKISQVKDIKAEDSVSYGRTFTAKENMRVATVTVGYADGYMRGLSGKGYMLIKGKKAPILGRVCMDQTVVDVTHIDDVKTGDTALLFGKELPVEEVAKILGTINYELVCAVAHRVPRIYIKNNKILDTVRYISL